MKISVFYDHILQAAEQSGKSLMTLLSDARAAGIEAVEIRLSCLTTQVETLALLEQAGLKISCIYEFYEMGGSGESLGRERSGMTNEIQKAQTHMNMAKRVGADKILVVPGFLSEEEAEKMQAARHSYEQTAAFFEENERVLSMAEGLRRMTAMGAEAGVTVTVEDFDDRRSPLCFTNGIRWFLEQIPGLRFTLDMGNFLYSGENVLAAWETLHKKICHVHCKDRGEKLSSVAAGDGCIPIAELIGRLKEDGYHGYLAIEHFDAPGQEQCMSRSAAFLKRQMYG